MSGSAQGKGACHVGTDFTLPQTDEVNKYWGSKAKNNENPGRFWRQMPWLFWNGGSHGSWMVCNVITGPLQLQEKGQKIIVRDDDSGTKKKKKEIMI